MWQRLKFRYGLRWTRVGVIETIALFIALILLLTALGIMANQWYGDYALSMSAGHWKMLAETREMKMADWLNGKPITTEPAGYKLHKTYFCELTAIPFGEK